MGLGDADYHRREQYPELPRRKLYNRTRNSLVNIFGQLDVRAPAVPISEQQLLCILALLDPDDPVMLNSGWVVCWATRPFFAAPSSTQAA